MAATFIKGMGMKTLNRGPPNTSKILCKVSEKEVSDFKYIYETALHNSLTFLNKFCGKLFIRFIWGDRGFGLENSNVKNAINDCNVTKECYHCNQLV